jgi:hypothetical protein
VLPHQRELSDRPGQARRLRLQKDGIGIPPGAVRALVLDIGRNQHFRYLFADFLNDLVVIRPGALGGHDGAMGMFGLDLTDGGGEAVLSRDALVELPRQLQDRIALSHAMLGLVAADRAVIVNDGSHVADAPQVRQRAGWRRELISR